MLIKGKKLINLPVYTKSGQLLGEVDDLEVETEGQLVVNYLVGNKNRIKNLFADKLAVHRSQIISIAEDKITVDDSVAEQAMLLAEDKKSSPAEISAGAMASVIKTAHKNQ